MPRGSDMKERLMKAAMDLIWLNGYGAASVDAICEQAGAKKGSFGGGLEQEEIANGLDLFTNCSTTGAVRSLLRFCVSESNESARAVRRDSRVPVCERRQRG